ncbi:MAG TPA: hypothetical protein VK654_08985 [Nitrospirota bacterium]|nr:hypothetical protein [Nitrospirota bacterium]
MRAKKMAAAMTAVQYYLEQEAAEAAAVNNRVTLPAAPAPVEMGQWAQSGLIDMMAGRRMVQLRAFSNLR